MSTDADAETTRRILEQRARAAARRPAAPDVTERLDILAFSLAGEQYGVEVSHVGEVCKLKDLTALPCTPASIAGVMNLRGQILAVVDLRRLFDLPNRGLTEFNKVIVLRGADRDFGLMADSIDGLQSVPVLSLQDGLPTLTGIRERFLKGVTVRMLAVLDGRKLLGDAGLGVNEQVGE